MKQFYIFVSVGVFSGLMSLIDISIGNNMGKDAIIALSVWVVLSWVVHVICSIGIRAYEVYLKYESECISLCFGMALLCSLVLILFNRQLVGMYVLTDKQAELVSKCIFWYAIFHPVEITTDYLDVWLSLNTRNKALYTANITYYVGMVGLDLLVLFFGFEVYWLCITTGICCGIYTVLVLVLCRFPFRRLMWGNIVKCFRHGWDIISCKIVAQVVTAIYNSFVSRLGTELMVIHSVCYTLANKSEEVTDAVFKFVVYRLQGISDFIKKRRLYKKICKMVFIPCIVIAYSFCLLLLFALKGTINYLDLLPFALMYLSQSMFIQLYESNRGYLSSCGDTKSIGYCNLVGSVARVGCILLIPYCGLYICAFAVSIDYLARGFYLNMRANKLVLKGGYIDG